MRSATGQAELLLTPTAGKVIGLVVYMHGIDSDENQLLHDDQLFPITRALFAAGYAIVASNAHGNNAGNPVSVQDQREAVDDAEAHLPPIQRVNILAFSMGGLDALLTAAGRNLPKLHAIALLSPACDQLTFLNGSFRGVISTAFGGADGDALLRAVSRNDPVTLAAAHFRGYAYHFWQSPGDHTVPASQTTRMIEHLRTGGVEASFTQINGDHGDLREVKPSDVVALFDAGGSQ